jgi:uncharacterized protein YydD (DUF2326 family)
MDEFNTELCKERHENLGREIKELKNDYTELRQAINGKFNKIMFGVFTTLLTVISALIVFIATRPIPPVVQ